MYHSFVREIYADGITHIQELFQLILDKARCTCCRSGHSEDGGAQRWRGHGSL